jgi:hypothetical protein
MLHELQTKQAAIVRDRTLTHFAIASDVAIVQNEGQATLDACRSYLEAWLRLLAEQTGEVRIHADSYRHVGTSIGDMKDRIDEFAAQHAVLQAWHSQCTWHPLFDHADDYHRTVYEEHGVLNWFRGILQTDGGLNASKMSVQWCRNVLRMVTPHMWVCRALLQQVDRAALEAVAQVTETSDAFRIALREGQGLDDLELALLPVLPVESVRVHKR